jgi:hypothetical protein
MDPSRWWRFYKTTRRILRGDFRGSSWGASEAEVLDTEVENLREGWTGTSKLFGYDVLLRYKFGDRGLRGGTYEFLLKDDDPLAAFEKVFEATTRELGIPVYLQRAHVELRDHASLSPASLLRSMILGAPRCVAAWVTDTSEVLLLMDASAIPLRLNFAARDASLYPTDTDTLILDCLRAA